MKNYSNRISILSLALLSVLATAAHADVQRLTAAQALQQEVMKLGPEEMTNTNYKRGLLKHIVLFRYQDSVTAEQKEQVKRRFLSLGKSLRNGRPYVLSIEAGNQSSGEGVDQNFEQAFIVTFKSEGDRNYYVGNPIITDSAFFDAAHQSFKEFVGPLLHTPINPTGVIVFDFKVRNK